MVALVTPCISDRGQIGALSFRFTELPRRQLFFGLLPIPSRRAQFLMFIWAKDAGSFPLSPGGE